MKQGWEYKKLGEVVQYFTGNRPSGGVGQIKEGALSLGGEHIGKDGYIDLSTAKYVPQDFYTVNTKGHIFDGDVLMCKDGALTGKVALVRNELNGLYSMVNEHVFILRSVSMIHPYLFYFLYSNNGQSQIKNRISGAAQGGLNTTNLKSIQIPVPPLTTQQSIVSELDILSQIIADYKEQLADYDKLEQSIFYDMFGDPVKNEKGWEVKKLGEIGICCSGGTPSRTKPDYFEGEITWYSAGELNDLFLGESIEKISNEALENSSAKLCPTASLFIGMYDTAAFKLGIATRPSCSNQACANITLKVDNVIWLYFTLLLMREEALKSRHGARQKNLNLGFIKDFSVPLPPLPLQQQFASKIESIEQMKADTKAALQDAELLFQSRMDYYFNG